MELYFERKIDGSGADQSKPVKLTIEEFVPISFKDGLLLAFESSIRDDDTIEHPMYEFNVVESMASVTLQTFDRPVLVAFYLIGGELNTLVVSELPSNYYNNGGRFYLINYKSYIEVCNLTGEDALPFKDYFKEYIIGQNGLENSFVEYSGAYYNKDEQPAQ